MSISGSMSILIEYIIIISIMIGIIVTNLAGFEYLYVFVSDGSDSLDIMVCLLMLFAILLFTCCVLL